MTKLIIRQLKREDAENFREIRLSGLKKNPEMFGSTYEVESQKPIELFIECIEKSVIWGAYHAGQIIGVIIFLQDTSLKSAHKANIYGFYVEPQFRNQGVATHLLHAVIDFAKQHVEQILLSVASNNEAAIHLYKKNGFQIYGIEPRALKNKSNYQDDLLMILFLESDIKLEMSQHLTTL